ncbi:uncharacterized protein LOC116257275 isoform X2 [Nymphaea colorata]|nr:uncharacterized protein LOC116257275 isoform X2 [Nymphaea colorata]XP_049934537.1 uncharacterized protein LOC116257275 isoform X2 [Nymphaea colorata]
MGEPGNAVSILVPEGKANDISGNTNLASNDLKVMFDIVPSVSIGLYSFVTVGFLATSLAATSLALASANLAATGALIEELAGADPSRNLLGMVGHLQVFALSSWLSSELSEEYFHTVKGLRWLIPHARVPWKKEDTSLEVYHQYPYGGADSLQITYGDWHTKQPLNDREIDGYVGTRFINYGLLLNSTEYFTYFLRREPLSAANVISNISNYTGWQDFQKNMFWLGTVGGSLVLLHLLILFLLKWRTRSSAKGELSLPRFEIFLMIILLPCLCQSSAFVIRGGTTGGITVGALLLALPVALVLSICLFMITAVFIGNFVQYKKIIIDNGEKVTWHSRLLDAIAGKHTIGKWCQMDRLPSTFLSRFGILFEDLKGPPTLVFVENSEPGNVPTWVTSDRSGIGRMRAISSDDGNNDAPLPTIERISGSADTAYIVIDLIRRIFLGIVFGAYPLEASRHQSILALSFTMLQFLYLFLLKPYISRGVQMVESVSLLCEAGIFGVSFYNLRTRKLEDQKAIGIWMLALFLMSFIGQLLNEWYALIKCLLRLPQSENPSFSLGMRFVAKGLVIPFLPRKYWSRFVSRKFSEPKTCLVPVVPLNPGPKMGNRRGGPMHVDTASASSATVVPLCLPDSPVLDDQLQLSTPLPEIAAVAHLGSIPRGTSSSTKKKKMRTADLKSPKGLKLASKNEIKLRELAKASFPGSRTTEGVGPSNAAQDSLFGSSDESEASSLIAQ